MRFVVFAPTQRIVLTVTQAQELLHFVKNPGLPTDAPPLSLVALWHLANFHRMRKKCAINARSYIRHVLVNAEITIPNEGDEAQRVGTSDG